MSIHEMKFEISKIKMSDIHSDDTFNCRGTISAMDVLDLINDIRENGLISPIIVCKYDPADRLSKGFRYRLIAGHRRTLAMKVVQADPKWTGEKVIDAIIRNDMKDERKARLFNLSENLHRKDLNMKQEANAVQKLIDVGMSRDEIAGELKMSPGWVQLREMLLKLPESVQAEVTAGMIGQGAIRQLYSINNLSGAEACIKAAHDAKVAKAEGKQANLKKHVAKSEKRIRKKKEIVELISHIIDTIGPSVATKAMAWCAGEVEDIDFENTLKKYSEVVGKMWIRPESFNFAFTGEMEKKLNE